MKLPYDKSVDLNSKRHIGIWSCGWHSMECNEMTKTIKYSTNSISLFSATELARVISARSDRRLAGWLYPSQTEVISPCFPTNRVSYFRIAVVYPRVPLGTANFYCAWLDCSPRWQINSARDTRSSRNRKFESRKGNRKEIKKEIDIEAIYLVIIVVYSLPATIEEKIVLRSRVLPTNQPFFL